MLPRTKQELALMRTSGRISAMALKGAILVAKPGVRLIDVDEVAEDTIIREGGRPAFKSVPGFYWATCLTVNDEVVHGLPRDIKLQRGDILGIDVGAEYKGWCTDAAWSLVVGGDRSKFLKAGEEALWDGIKKAIAGNKVGDISAAIQEKIEKSGFSVVRSLVGHGVGKKLHEEPEIPGFGKVGTGAPLLEDMTIAIEVIYTQGSHETVIADDGWTISSRDGSLGGLFEMTVIVGKHNAEVLTDWRLVQG